MDSAINVATMEHEQIQNYQQTLLNKVFEQKLQQNENQIKVWTDYKNGHKKVIEGLQIFPLSISENCMVPIGKRAFIKGKLIHTNEILACLGDGYFAKYSASQAITLCNRRIERADEMLESLEAERNLYEMRQILPLKHDAFGEEGRKDILEHWNENEVDEWRVKHRQREKEYYQKLAKEKERTDNCTEKDLFKRLDELELEEELGNEMYRMEANRKEFYDDDLEEGEVYDEGESSEEDSSDSDEITTEMLQKELERLKEIQESRSASVQSSDVTQNEILNTNVTENKQSDLIVNTSQEESKKSHSPKPRDSSESTTNIKKRERVSFVEPCITEDRYDAEDKESTFEIDPRKDDTSDNEDSIDDNDIIRIEFSHSSHTPNTPESSTTEVQSPVDIYKMFNTSKSILKRSPNDMPNQAIASPNERNSTDTEDENPVNLCRTTLEINDVQERKVTSFATKIISKKSDERKPMSRFKMKRAEILRS